MPRQTRPCRSTEREGCSERTAGAVRRTEAKRSPQQPDPSTAWSARRPTATGDGAGEGARPEQEEKPADQDGYLKVPDGPGLGVTPVEAAIKEGRMPGEPYWD